MACRRPKTSIARAIGGGPIARPTIDMAAGNPASAACPLSSLAAMVITMNPARYPTPMQPRATNNAPRMRRRPAAVMPGDAARALMSWTGVYAPVRGAAATGAPARLSRK